MLHTLSERIADFLFDEKDKYPLDVYTYGFELIVSSLLELLMLMIIGVLSGELVETIIFVIIFSLLRFFTGGYHAKTYLRCGVITAINFLSVLISTELLLMCTSEIIRFVCFISFLFSFYIISKYAPIENENKKLYNKKRLKIIAVLILLLETTVFVIIYKSLKINQALIFIPTILSVDILMLVEIFKNGGKANEKNSKNSIKRFERKGK